MWNSGRWSPRAVQGRGRAGAQGAGLLGEPSGPAALVDGPPAQVGHQQEQPDHSALRVALRPERLPDLVPERLEGTTDPSSTFPCHQLLLSLSGEELAPNGQ